MTRERITSDLPALLERLGLGFIRVKGDEVWAECPSHHDSGDSWSINSVNGGHRCFACGYRGYLQGLVMDVLDCDNFVANRIIRSFGLEPPDPDRIIAALEAPVPERYVWVAENRIREYIDPPGWALDARHLTAESAEHYGLRWRDDRHAWIIPIRSPGGVLLGWQEKDQDGPRVRNLPFEMHKGVTVFGAEHMNGWGDRLILESPLDVVYLHTLGYDHAIATFGSAVSNLQLRLAMEYASRIVLGLDNDEAGIESMARIASGESWDQSGRRHMTIRWANRMTMAVLDYPNPPGSKPKDVGDMTVDQITSLMASPVHVVDWLPRQERINADVIPRNAPSLSVRGIRPHDRRARPDRGLRDGPRQDPRDHRSSRGAHRER